MKPRRPRPVAAAIGEPLALSSLAALLLRLHRTPVLQLVQTSAQPTHGTEATQPAADHAQA